MVGVLHLSVPAAHFLINKFARRGLLEKCAVADRDPAINASSRAE
jgi:hypothetical protein